MSDSKYIVLNLLVIFVTCALSVTLGGHLVYQSTESFFNLSSDLNKMNAVSPATIYYTLTLVIGLMYFLLKLNFRLYELISSGILSIVFALSMSKMVPGVYRPIYIFLIPLVMLFVSEWIILKFIFLNARFRAIRLLLFSILSAIALTIAFRVQFFMLQYPISSDFFQARFLSGIMLFIFLGFGLSMSEFIISKIIPRDNSELSNEQNDIDEK